MCSVWEGWSVLSGCFSLMFIVQPVCVVFGKDVVFYILSGCISLIYIVQPVCALGVLVIQCSYSFIEHITQITAWLLIPLCDCLKHGGLVTCAVSRADIKVQSLMQTQRLGPNHSPFQPINTFLQEQGGEGGHLIGCWAQNINNLSPEWRTFPFNVSQ